MHAEFEDIWAIHMHHTNRVRPFIIADDGRLADVSVCEQAERDRVFLVQL